MPAPSPGVARVAVPLVVAALVVSLFIPYQFKVGPLLMSASRFVLIVAFIPCVVLWLSGRAGRIRLPDIALFAMCGWVLVSLSMVHGFGFALEPAGIFTIETMSAFLLARVFIRDADTFYATIRLSYIIILALMPFALFETLTGQNILLETANSVMFAADDVYKDPRWGLDRVQGLFEHPIHFGVVTGAFLALTFCVLGHGKSFAARMGQTAMVFMTAFTSLSSGPFTALIVQTMLVSYDRALSFLRQRWMLLLAGASVLVFALEIASNRSLPKLFIHYFSFNPHTAYNRLHIWEFGTASVANHPLFGTGFGEWERPEWMSGSMDMFWLVPAVQNGLPAAILLQVAVLGLFIAIVRMRAPDARTADYKLGFLICIFGFYMTGWTVHYWKVVYILFFFLLGSGAWLLDVNSKEAPVAAPRDDDQNGWTPRRRMRRPASGRTGQPSKRRGRASETVRRQRESVSRRRRV